MLFDRSWYNRAGVERVMGFCTDDEYEEFFRSVPEFEKMLVRSGIVLVKYWFSISDEEQHRRFQMRIRDPLKQWKLSPMDLESRRRWELYTKAKEVMLQRTHIPEARWWMVEADDKKRARLNCIHHLLGQIPYGEMPDEPVTLPNRIHHPDYQRRELPDEMFVPSIYLIEPDTLLAPHRAVPAAAKEQHCAEGARRDREESRRSRTRSRSERGLRACSCRRSRRRWSSATPAR